MNKEKDKISKEDLDIFWNVKVWPLGITKWQYTLGFLIMGFSSLIFLLFYFLWRLTL